MLVPIAHSLPFQIDDLRIVSGPNNYGTPPFPNATKTAALTIPSSGPLGYIRAYEGHVDSSAVYLIGGPKLDVNICRPSQRQPVNTAKFPRLSAAPGDFVMGTYLENGHISLQPSASSTSGTTYWYATTQPKPDETLSNVRNWTTDGRGGDARGRLLAQAPFDDGTCVEPNSTPIAAQRKASGGGGACKSVFKVPETAVPGTVLTVYWVWDFSNHFGPEKVGHVEWYTSCMDIQVVKGKGRPKRGLGASAKFRGRV